MITLWLNHHLGLQGWLAFSYHSKVREHDSYSTYQELGLHVLWHVEF